jgi:hypothetical protein
MGNTLSSRFTRIDWLANGPLQLKKKSARAAGGTRHPPASIPGTGLAHEVPADAITMRSSIGLNSGRCCESRGSCA